MNLRCLLKISLIPTVLLCALPPARAEDATPSLQNCSLPAKRMAKLELIFGLKTKFGPVTSRAWAKFMGREVTPRFPDGLTVLNGYGQWRGKHSTIDQEPSRLLLIWYVRDDASDAKIEAIRAAYKRQFHQDSVLRADEVSCVSF